MSQENVETVRRIFEDFETPGWDTASPCWTQTSNLTGPPRTVHMPTSIAAVKPFDR